VCVEREREREREREKGVSAENLYVTRRRQWDMPAEMSSSVEYSCRRSVWYSDEEVWSRENTCRHRGVKRLLLVIRRQ
jgi:hypothetical protein